MPVQAPSMNSIQLTKAPPPVRDMLNELLPLLDVVVVAGPPASFILVPWLLLVLVLVGPFLLLLTMAAIALVVVLVVALIVAILATPYLLVRRLRGRQAAPAPSPILVRQVRVAKP